MEDRILTFIINGKHFAIPLNQVYEINQLRNNPYVGQKELYLGNRLLRDKSIDIINASALLNIDLAHPPSNATLLTLREDSHWLGFLIDEVAGIKNTKEVVQEGSKELFPYPFTKGILKSQFNIYYLLELDLQSIFEKIITHQKLNQVG